jgi:hypothetical protein
MLVVSSSTTVGEKKESSAMALGTVDASAVVDLFTQNWQMIILTH